MSLENRIWLLVIAGILSAVLLGACSTPTVDVQQMCLPLATYTQADQTELGAEIRALDPVKQRMVVRALGDFKAMRDDDRTCISAPH